MDKKTITPQILIDFAKKFPSCPVKLTGFGITEDGNCIPLPAEVTKELEKKI